MFKVRISWNIKKISALTMSAILLFNMIPGIILFVFADDAEEVLQTAQEELDKESANVKESELTEEPLPVQEEPKIEKEVVYNNVASEEEINTDWYNSEAELFEISSKEEFKGLAKLVNEGNSFLGKTIKLTDDIDINGEELVPIGTSENPFKGTFEGDYNTIYNFSINGTSTDNQGLFGCISGGTIQNLFLSDFKVVATKGINKIGGIVGYATQQSAIINCKAESSGEIQSYGKYTGGIVGYAYNGVISGCTNEGAVSGSSRVGGIVGCAEGIKEISGCTNEGAVSGNNDCVGGIVGHAYSDVKISGCTNEGAVSGSKYVGGIAGYADWDKDIDGFEDWHAVISNCTNEGAVSGDDNSVGGIIGYVDGYEYWYAHFGTYEYREGDVVISNCTNEGAVSGSKYVGGIVGYAYPVNAINDCTNEGAVSGNDEVGGIVGYADNSVISGCTNKGEIRGHDYVGGIAGYADRYSDRYGDTDAYRFVDGDVVISNCTNEGEIRGHDYVGGIAGYAEGNQNLDEFGGRYGDWNAVISNCTNYGEVDGNYRIGGIIGYAYQIDAISNCTNEGAVSGSKYVGGIVGYAYNVEVSGCTNEGAVSGNESVGGIVGYASYGNGIDTCINYGAVSGNESVGGIVGYVGNGVISGCTNEGAVSGNESVGGIVGYVGGGVISGCTNEGAVDGDYRIGGIIGYANGIKEISDCTNEGAVTGKSGVGGIAGKVYETDINNAKNFGDIEGGYQVGGIVGYCYSDSVLGQNSDAKIEDCRNYGNVEGIDKPAADTKNNEEDEYTSVGGIVGRGIHIYINKCTNYGIIEGTRSVGGVAGYTTDSWIENCNNGDSTYINVTNVIGKDDVGGIVGTFGGTKGNESLNYLKYNSNYANISGSTEVGQIYGWRSKYSKEENNHGYASVSKVKVASIQEQVPYAEMPNPDPVVSTLSGTALAPVTLKSLNKEIPDVQKAIESAEKINATDSSNTETIVLEEEEKGFFERIWAWILNNIDKVKEFIKNNWNGCNFKYQISRVRV